LAPNIKRTPWTEQEELILFLYHKQIGNHWSEISTEIPGRSDNAIKNYWNSNMRKKIKKYLRRYNQIKTDILNNSPSIKSQPKAIITLVQDLIDLDGKDYHSLNGLHNTSLRKRRQAEAKDEAKNNV